MLKREAREFQLYQFRYCFRENIKYITQTTRMILIYSITMNSLKHQLANVHTRISQTTQFALRARTQVLRTNVTLRRIPNASVTSKTLRIKSTEIRAVSTLQIVRSLPRVFSHFCSSLTHSAHSRVTYTQLSHINIHS